MDITFLIKLLEDLEDLSEEREFFASSCTNKRTKTIKKLKNEKWLGVKIYKGLIQFLFKSFIMTFKLNRSTFIANKNVSSIKNEADYVLKLYYKNHDKYSESKYSSMRLYLVNTNLVSNKLNYIVNSSPRKEAWLGYEGKINVQFKEFEKAAKQNGHRKLYQFLLNDFSWGVPDYIISELYWEMGYGEHKLVGECDLEKMYKRLAQLLISAYLLGGKKKNLDGERGEFFRNYQIHNKKNEGIIRKEYKGNYFFINTNLDNSIQIKNNA